FTDTTNKQLVINGIVLRDTKATLYNLQGREVTSTLLNTYSTSQYMDISTLQNGVYIAVIHNQQQNIVKKIIITP
ncbi:T9SS type A sorting domain-containing protein, partial [Winogradskyella sp. KYW1333]|uniref:T9SS type A sorting domain-containing protein n=1 Tax=Winogradskyella sp. KYW1333 TaxID=2282123 RepID=UPI000E061F3C